MSDATPVPKAVRQLVILASALLLASLVISGFNAYATLAAPPQSPYVPTVVGFEGQLANAAGQPVADGNYTITFSLYSQATGGTALWSETQSVAVVDGLYSVQLGAVTPLNPTHFEGNRWLGVQVSGDSEMLPRVPISAVPFALNARQAMGLQGYDVASTAPQNGEVLIWDANTNHWSPTDPTGIIDNGIVQGRLTLESGVPVSTTGQAAKTTLYFTPYRGNRIVLYDGSRWAMYAFDELSIPVPATAANTNYDVFIYDAGANLVLETVAWGGNTTRSVSLTTQDGVYVKSGDPTHRYLGTIRSVEVGQTEDSTLHRFVWNYYNRVARTIFKAGSAVNITSPGYGGFGTSDFLIGVGEATVSFELQAATYNTWNNYAVTGNPAIAIDATGTQHAQMYHSSTYHGGYTPSSAHYLGTPSAGYHTVWFGAYSDAAGGAWSYWTSQTGLFGWVEG